MSGKSEHLRGLYEDGHREAQDEAESQVAGMEARLAALKGEQPQPTREGQRIHAESAMPFMAIGLEQQRDRIGAAMEYHGGFSDQGTRNEILGHLNSAIDLIRSCSAGYDRPMSDGPKISASTPSVPGPGLSIGG